MPRRLLVAFATPLFLAGLLACSPMIDQRGQRFAESDLAAIRPGVTTREEVMQLLGSPSTVAPFDPDTWLYVRQTIARTATRREVEDQQVVVISFDDAGVVERVETRGLEQARVVEPVADRTPTLGNEQSVFRQLIQNIGRFTGRRAHEEP